MKAVIDMGEKSIEVIGKDLTIDSNILTGETYVVDRAADNRRIFYGHTSLINCVHIIDSTWMPLPEPYKQEVYRNEA